MGASTTMNIPKIVAELRFELKLVKASIHAFEQSKETFMEVDVRHLKHRIRRKLRPRSSDEMPFRKVFGAI